MAIFRSSHGLRSRMKSWRAAASVRLAAMIGLLTLLLPGNVVAHTATAPFERRKPLWVGIELGAIVQAGHRGMRGSLLIGGDLGAVTRLFCRPPTALATPPDDADGGVAETPEPWPTVRTSPTPSSAPPVAPPPTVRSAPVPPPASLPASLAPASPASELLPARADDEELALARGLIAAAFHTAGLDSLESRLDGALARAHVAAALPETRLRAMRVDGESFRVAPREDRDRWTGRTGTTTWLEGRLTWHLDRLVYATEETRWARLRHDLVERRSRLAARVLEAYAKYRRAAAAERRRDDNGDRNDSASERRLDAMLQLDVMTGGWFGAHEAARPPPPP